MIKFRITLFGVQKSIDLANLWFRDDLSAEKPFFLSYAFFLFKINVDEWMNIYNLKSKLIYSCCGVKVLENRSEQSFNYFDV